MLSGPSSWKNVTMPARSPVSSDATVTTVVMPMTMPSTVSSERKRFAHTADIAIVMFSRGDADDFIRLLRAQGHHRIEFRGARRRIPAADHPDRAGHE